jgi:hypothetical protein
LPEATEQRFGKITVADILTEIEMRDVTEYDIVRCDDIYITTCGVKINVSK